MEGRMRRKTPGAIGLQGLRGVIGVVAGVGMIRAAAVAGATCRCPACAALQPQTIFFLSSLDHHKHDHYDHHYRRNLLTPPHPLLLLLPLLLDPLASLRRHPLQSHRPLRSGKDLSSTMTVQSSTDRKHGKNHAQRRTPKKKKKHRDPCHALASQNLNFNS